MAPEGTHVVKGTDACGFLIAQSPARATCEQGVLVQTSLQSSNSGSYWEATGLTEDKEWTELDFHLSGLRALVV